MASQQEKAFCVLRFEVSRSVITVQREFRARFRKDAPHKNNINRWYRQFVETACLGKGKSTGRPRVCDDYVRERMLRDFITFNFHPKTQSIREYIDQVFTAAEFLGYEVGEQQ